MGRPGHVLMTADAVGGVWTYAVDLARELTERRVRTTVAVLGPKPSAKQQSQAQASGAELKLLGGPLDWTAETAGEVDAAGLKLCMLASELRPDIVQLNSPALGANVRFGAPVIAVAHSCVKTWWAAVKGDETLPGDLAWRAAMTGRGYAAADAVVAPSRAFAAATQAAYGLADPPRVVSNGRPARALAYGANDRAVFTAGRLWDEGKDVRTLDRAAARLDLPAIAAGPLDGPNGARIAFDHLDAMGVLDQETLDRRLAARPIFVSTSIYEPFGLAVLEAAQAACPLVLADIATFRELWDGAAVFFPPGNDTMLAEVLQSLAADDARRAELGQLARARADRYAARAMAAGMLDIYGERIAVRAAARGAA